MSTPPAVMGAHGKWARVIDRTAETAPAREAFLATLEPPAEVTDPKQRESMRRHALALHMERMRAARRRKAEALRAAASQIEAEFDASGLEQAGSDSSDAA